ncbi:MAG: Holliday junction resolvase RuvX [Burkholderiales bacterium]|nr:Holliday junction resolvase RuvX [Burkholderiales bacterium]
MTPTGTLIGFDFGERRIGVAVGETGTRIANPIGAIEASANDARFREIGKLVDEWHPAAFVVGRPRHADDSEHAVAKLAEKFARRLRAKYNVPVVMVDETLTSAAAESSLRATRTRAARKSDVDAVAAAIILQSYLDDPDAGDDAAA